MKLNPRLAGFEFAGSDEFAQPACIEASAAAVPGVTCSSGGIPIDGRVASLHLAVIGDARKSFVVAELGKILESGFDAPVRIKVEVFHAVHVCAERVRRIMCLADFPTNFRFEDFLLVVEGGQATGISGSKTFMTR